MTDIAIKAENIGKLYRLGQIGTGTISHDLNRWWARVRGKEDPFAKIGQVNDRTTKSESDYVWALRGVDFEIKKGEAVGIIGRNGAGKSTLLKLLSKVTKPTNGEIKINGRIASLLEVGTGFHPEMTGRENIYLNGAILGMTKKEIERKFDEIVDFSGVERYVDTPVKRYSSGMYVRLAFAVAAHLESEILIVDEVLAVGDAEFQKKCLGKMGEVSKGEGRTVLFVSHNMQSVLNLCKNGMLVKNGSIDDFGEVTKVISKYLADFSSSSSFEKKLQEDAKIQLLTAHLVAVTNVDLFINIEIYSVQPSACSIDFRISDHLQNAFAFGSLGTFKESDKLSLDKGVNKFSFSLDARYLANGLFTLSIDLTNPFVDYYDRSENCLTFEIVKSQVDSKLFLNQNWQYGSYCIEVKKIK